MEQESAGRLEQIRKNDQIENSYLYSLKEVAESGLQSAELALSAFLLFSEGYWRYLSIHQAALAGQCCRI